MGRGGRFRRRRNVDRRDAGAFLGARIGRRILREVPGNLDRGSGVPAQDAGDGGARRLVHDIDETLCQLGILPLFLLGMGRTLNIKCGQCQQQPRPDVVARTVGQSEQVFPVDCRRGHAVPPRIGMRSMGIWNRRSFITGAR